MGPEFGVGIGSKNGAGRPQRPRPTLLIRGVEMAGLAMVSYGLATYRFGFVVAGGAMIVGSYALYRRKHGPTPTGRSDGDLWGSDADGGAD